MTGIGAPAPDAEQVVQVALRVDVQVLRGRDPHVLLAPGVGGAVGLVAARAQPILEDEAGELPPLAHARAVAEEEARGLARRQRLRVAHHRVRHALELERREPRLVDDLGVLGPQQQLERRLRREHRRERAVLDRRRQVRRAAPVRRHVRHELGVLLLLAESAASAAPSAAPSAAAGRAAAAPPAPRPPAAAAPPAARRRRLRRVPRRPAPPPAPPPWGASPRRRSPSARLTNSRAHRRAERPARRRGCDDRCALPMGQPLQRHRLWK